MNEVLIREAIEKYDTPLYIFDLDDLKDTMMIARKILNGKAGLCYAMKANPFIASAMSKYADRIEVCSYGEFLACMQENIPPEKLLISGVLKIKKELYDILERTAGRAIYTVESMSQLKDMRTWALQTKTRLHILIRLTSGNQFGMDEEDVMKAASVIQKDPYLTLEGLHFFSGTQKRKTELIKKELEELDRVMRRLAQYRKDAGGTGKSGSLDSEKLSAASEELTLEYGPGLNADYFVNDRKLLSFPEELTDVAGMLSPCGYRVTIEMGRPLSADCGYYVTRVKDIKKNAGNLYALVDGGIHHIHYDGQMNGIWHPKISLLKYDKTQAEANSGTQTDKEENWNICGSLCSVNDILCRNIAFCGLASGDVLVFSKAGAYSMTEGMSLFLSHALPAAVFFSKSEGWTIARGHIDTYNFNIKSED